MSSKITTENTSTKWLEQMGSSIALLDQEFQFVAATDSWFHNFKFDRGESNLVGQSIFSIFPTRSEDLNTRLKYALDGLKDIQIMFRSNELNTKDKDSIWFLNPWKDGYGNTIGVVINVKEVSERKSLELDLKKTKHLLNQKSEIAKIGSWELSVQENKLFWSEKVKEIHGVSKNFSPDIESSFSFFKKGASYMTIKRAFDEAIKNAKPWNETLQIVAHDGSTKWVNSIGRPKFKDGKCSRILGTLQEVEKVDFVSSPIKVEEKLDFKKLFQNTIVPMAYCDFESGKILTSNTALHNILGVNGKDLKNKKFGTYISFDKGTRYKILRSIASKKAFRPVRVSFVREGSTPIVIEISGKLEKQQSGRTMIAAIINRTVKPQIERSDSQALDADVEIEKLVTFNHMVAHNLKAHATNISLLLGFIDKETNTGERNNMMKLLFQSTDYLMNEIKGFREMVAIGENKGLKKVSLPLNDFIFSAEQKLSGLIKKEGVKIFNGIEDSLKVDVVPVYMESIVDNILSNSIKFKKEDKNPVVVFNTSETPEHHILSIEDNGIGIDLEKHKDKIFGLYKTINSSKSSGMGLYLAKYQMELMKGKIEVESKVGIGTTFKLFIPKK